jgi:hypothetical protein
MNYRRFGIQLVPNSSDDREYGAGWRREKVAGHYG